MLRQSLLSCFLALVVFCLGTEEGIAGRFSVSLGYAVKWMNGTDIDPNDSFDITAPPASRIDRLQDSQGGYFVAVTPDPRGLALPSKTLNGLSLGASYRISNKVTFSLTYSLYFRRFGSTVLKWEQYPGDSTRGNYEVFEYDSRYTQRDLLAAFEYRTGWHGLFLMAAREVSYGSIREKRRWTNTYYGELNYVHPYVYDTEGLSALLAVGLGRDWVIAKRTLARVTFTYSFQHWTGGSRVSFSVCREL